MFPRRARCAHCLVMILVLLLLNRVPSIQDFSASLIVKPQLVYFLHKLYLFLEQKTLTLFTTCSISSFFDFAIDASSYSPEHLCFSKSISSSRLDSLWAYVSTYRQKFEPSENRKKKFIPHDAVDPLASIVHLGWTCGYRVLLSLPSISAASLWFPPGIRWP